MSVAGSAAVFLDRDGVINDLVWDERTQSHESPYDPKDVVLVDGAAEGIGILRTAGYKLVVVSNQPAAAKGIVSLTTLEQVNARVSSLLAESEVELDAYYLCFHHPAGTVPDLTAKCTCRKPEPGLLIKAASEMGLALVESWIVGDSETDVAAGRAVGCKTTLLENPRSAHRRPGKLTADIGAANLLEAAEAISGHDSR